jgi:hypothetical protein
MKPVTQSRAYLFRYPFTTISIEPGIDSLGRTLFRRWGADFRPDLDQDPRTRRRTLRRLEAMVFTLVAGNAVQLILTGRNDHVGASEDSDYAGRLAGFVSGDPDEANAFVKWQRLRARNTLAQAPNWAAVKAVASALLEKNVLSARHARRIIRVALDSDADEWPLAEREERR